jgi:predicted DCC family thiol-disulfide oxidoreductase YuxK
MRRLWGAWRAYWFRPEPVFNLAVCRILLVWIHLTHLLGWNAHQSFAIRAQLPHTLYDPLPVLRLLTLPWGFAGWGSLLDGAWGFRPTVGVLDAVYWVTVVAGVLALIGLRTNVSLLAFTLGNLFMQGYLYSFNDSHHSYNALFITLLLLALGPSGGALSVDAVRHRLREAGATGRLAGPSALKERSAFARWPLLLVRWVLALVYLSAGLHKLLTGGLAWMNGYTLQYYLYRDGVRWGNGLGIWLSQQHELCAVLAGGSLLLELLFPLVLIWPRLAWVILPAGAAMHAGIYWTMSVGFYRQIATYAVFIPWTQGLRALARRFAWAGGRARPEVLYDGHCPLCRRSMALLRWADWFDQLRYTDVEAGWARIAQQHPGLSREACLRDMHVVLPGGSVRAGFFAYRAILRHTPLLWPLRLLMYLPMASVVGPRVYAFIASRRPRVEPCAAAHCEAASSPGFLPRPVPAEGLGWPRWVLGGIGVLPLVLWGAMAWCAIERPDWFLAWTREDGWVESSQVVGWLVAAWLSWRIARHARRLGLRRGALLYGAAAVGLLWIAGEEVSWGQRLLHLPTPAWMAAHNLQQELTIHNIGTLAPSLRWWASLGVAGASALSALAWMVRPAWMRRPHSALWVAHPILWPSLISVLGYWGLRRFTPGLSGMEELRQAVSGRLPELFELMLALATVLFLAVVLQQVRGRLTSAAPVRAQARVLRPASLALVGLLGIALWLRLERLGKPSFDIDEYLHVFAAQSLNATGRPTLPSGADYTRALPHTWLVAESFRWFGVSEASARLPGVLLDLGSVLVLFLMARRWFGTAAALVAAGALALSPWWIQAARTSRMYSLFHLLYLIAGWALWQALEGSRGIRRLAWAALALAVFALALRTHTLAMVLGAAAGLFVIGMALATRARRYVALALLGLTAVGAAVSAGWMNPQRLWETVNSAPVWSQGSRYAWGYYLRELWPTYPLWVVLYPLALWGLWKRSRTLAWCFICLGLAPFALHSVIFDAKRLRYVLYLLPWFLLAVAPLVAGWLRGVLALRPGWRLAIGVASVAVIGHAWLWQVPRVTEEFPSPPWRDAYGWLRARLAPEDAIVTSMPLATQYYLGRPASYVMNNVHLQGVLATRRRAADGARLDGYAGRPMLTTLEELKRALASHPRGWILIDRGRFQTKTMTRPMLTYITERLEPVDAPAAARGANPVLIYRWDHQAPVRVARRAEELGG